MMFIKILLSCCLALLITADYVPVHERVQNNADFIYHSQVDGTPDSKLKIGCYIKNNSGTPLAVQWDDCGVVAKGFYQLGPGELQAKDSIAQEPFLLDHSEIKYGNAFQYSTDGRCYYDGQARSKASAQTRTSEYERENENGTKLFRIEVASTLSEGARSATLRFNVVGGSSLVLPSRLGSEINSFNNAKGDGGWEITKTTSLNQLGIKDESDRDAISDWLNNTPKLNSMGPGSDLVVLKNKTRGSNEISFPLTGVNWSVEKVYLIAFMPNKLGFFGLTADMYLPH